MVCLNLYNKPIGRAKNWAQTSWSLLQRCTFQWQWELPKRLHLLMQDFFWNPSVLRMEDEVIPATLFSENAAPFYFVQSLCISRWIMALILSFNFHCRSKVTLKGIKPALQKEWRWCLVGMCSVSQMWKTIEISLTFLVILWYFYSLQLSIPEHELDTLLHLVAKSTIVASLFLKHQSECNTMMWWEVSSSEYCPIRRCR